MYGFTKSAHAIQWDRGQERIKVEAWGLDSLRIRSTIGSDIRDDLPGALLEPAPVEAEIGISTGFARIRNGAIVAEIQIMKTNGNHEPGYAAIRFLNAITGLELLAEKSFDANQIPSRRFKSIGLSHFQIEVEFAAYSGERVYGLGQHQHHRLDQKGLVIDLVQRNAEVCIPFLLSSRGYGLLWNNPAMGRVELLQHHTSWSIVSSRQIDYWITAGGLPQRILENYADATGHAPMLPEWASGFWQSKLRYRTQEEVMAVVHGYKRRGLPISAMVIDALHWTLHGDWRFDPQDWPDPERMVSELEELGIKVMVSIWPTVNPRSDNFNEMRRRALLVRTVPPNKPATWSIDRIPDGYVGLYLYDATNPEAREFLWEQIRKGYYSLGIRNWWLDVCEPETTLLTSECLRYHLGGGASVTNIYPLLHARGFYAGMRAEGETEILNLCRSAWAGSQRYGVAVWSGDVGSSFEALQAQVPAGLNIGLSGIPWWCTDIGGFYDETPENFQELIVRWFQYGTFCPIFRLHGYRKPHKDPDSSSITGGPNEVWSFGDRAYAIIREYLFLRERLRPYIQEQMRLAHERGLPPMRPLFFDFPNDADCQMVEDQFMFGPDLLVAPILHEGAWHRDVYLPQGIDWINAWTDQVISGGQWIKASAPLERIPLYLKKGAFLPIRFDRGH